MTAHKSIHNPLAGQNSDCIIHKGQVVNVPLQLSPMRESVTFRFNNALLSFPVHERHRAKTLWEKTGAVVMVVRRPG